LLNSPEERKPAAAHQGTTRSLQYRFSQSPFQSCTISIRSHYVTFPGLNWPNVLGVSQGRSQGLSRYNDAGIQMPAGARDVSSPKRPDRLWTPLSLPFSGYSGNLSARVKWPRRESDLLPPSSAEIKNEWSRTFKTSVCFGFPCFALRSLWCGVQLLLYRTAGWNKC
jgi:hypothetical protein